mmetsp:Transcript_6362/g.19235  ORF Transcript_6362/g.19235 Transcript_6362/m.19235 type:complete len:366 (+) Transcript_6362:163-1260(+)|eukprot:CAMPEP_0198729908 /NCGR_PEP_ID=MMETSP1475-20131203/21636_1 /TAXON_ID= ORGANISM="Unidentified sp., Strain CCMP1999" /NCGR_SAMPLE_ID=MMETSP1475 /ASSEMBLY_ACC=CAM_ASM_001111 /LENGTH=365 /DNA_ID=CAMNT_0044492631 /DNA_START=122 /DNA_END=1219 /DNA_ORIENTATION=-
MEALPEDVLVKIANYLPRRDAVNLSLCSHGIHGALQRWLHFVGSSGEDDVEMSLKLVGRQVLSFGPSAVSANGRVTAMVVRELLGTTLYRIDTEKRSESTYALDLDMQSKNCVEVSYSGKMAVVSGGAGIMRIFSGDDLEQCQLAEVGEPLAFVRISPSERFIVAAVESRPELLLFSAEGALLQNIQLGRKVVTPRWHSLDFTLDGDIVVTLGTTASQKVTTINMSIVCDSVVTTSISSSEETPLVRPQHFELFEINEEDTEKEDTFKKANYRDVAHAASQTDQGHYLLSSEDGDLWLPSSPESRVEPQIEERRWVGFGAVSRRGPWMVKYTVKEPAPLTSPSDWCGIKVSVTHLSDEEATDAAF